MSGTTPQADGPEKENSSDRLSVNTTTTLRDPVDVPPPPRAPEVSGDGLREAQKLAGLTLKIDLTEGGRMRAELTGAAFPLAPSRTD